MTPTSRRRRTQVFGAALLTLALAGTSACSAGDSDSEGSGSDGVASALDQMVEERPTNYVALGDSFTAAPFVPNSDEAAGCFRSTSNYPALISQALPETKVVDVSCSAADTTHMKKQQTTTTGGKVPPQFRALTPETDLVTLGIGGNDFNVYGTLITRCPELVSQDPQGSPCRDEMNESGEDVLLADIERTGDRLATVINGVKERSPDARILLVNYPVLAPANGQCDELPLARGDYGYTFEIATALDRTLRDAAAAADVELIDLWSASQGHDICSDEPWVNGQVTDFSKALSYHPFAVGQQAAADLVLEALNVS